MPREIHGDCCGRYALRRALNTPSSAQPWRRFRKSAEQIRMVSRERVRRRTDSHVDRRACAQGISDAGRKRYSCSVCCRRSPSCNCNDSENLLNFIPKATFSFIHFVPLDNLLSPARLRSLGARCCTMWARPRPFAWRQLHLFRRSRGCRREDRGTDPPAPRAFQTTTPIRFSHSSRITCVSPML